MQRAVDKAQAVPTLKFIICLRVNGLCSPRTHEKLQVFNALPYRERAVEYAKAVELDPRNQDYKTNLANALFAYAQMRLLTRNSQFAKGVYREAADLQRELLAEDQTINTSGKIPSDGT